MLGMTQVCVFPLLTTMFTTFGDYELEMVINELYLAYSEFLLDGY